MIRNYTIALSFSSTISCYQLFYLLLPFSLTFSLSLLPLWIRTLRFRWYFSLHLPRIKSKDRGALMPSTIQARFAFDLLFCFVFLLLIFISLSRRSNGESNGCMLIMLLSWIGIFSLERERIVKFRFRKRTDYRVELVDFWQSMPVKFVWKFTHGWPTSISIFYSTAQGHVKY